MIKDVKRQTLRMTVTQRVPLGRGKGFVIKKMEVLPESNRAPSLDTRRFNQQSSMSRLSKKKQIKYICIYASEKILELSKQIEVLKEKKIERLFRMYDSRPMSERNMKEFKTLLCMLFGKRSAESLLEKFLRNKQVKLN